MRFAKLGKITVRERRSGCAFERLVSLEQDRPFCDIQPTKVDPIARQSPKRLDIGGRKKTRGLEGGNIDKIRIPRKRGKTLIRRIAVTCRPKRAKLPIMNARSLEKPEPRADRARFKATDSIVSRQARRMHQHSYRAMVSAWLGRLWNRLP